MGAVDRVQRAPVCLDEQGQLAKWKTAFKQRRLAGKSAVLSREAPREIIQVGATRWL